MENKKTWLYGVVAVAAVAAIAVGFSMKGSYFQGLIGNNCPADGKGCPVSGPEVGKGSGSISRDLWAAYLTRNDKGVNSATKDCAPDLVGSQYAKYVCYAISKGYLTTYSDGNFHPEFSVTRAVGAKDIHEVFGVPTDIGTALANDIVYDSWYYPYVNGFIKKECPDTLDGGGVQGNFYPEEQLSISTAKNWVLCAQGKSMSKPVTGPVTKPAAKVFYTNRISLTRSLVTAAGYDSATVATCTENNFSDLKAGSSEAKYACQGAKIGFSKGYSDGTFRPSNNVTRAEGLKMFVIALGLEVAGPSQECLDVPASHWFNPYVEIISSNSFPSFRDASGNCNPDQKLTVTETKAWLNHSKTL
ncbi:MAG: S-layer homology domain-containing protein [Patescibacteria group bacterium]